MRNTYSTHPSQVVHTPTSRLISFIKLSISPTTLPHSNRLQSRPAPSLPGSLRASAKRIAGSSSSPVKPFAEQLSATREVLHSVPEEHSTLVEQWPDDFEQISYDELRASLALGDSNLSSAAFDYQFPAQSSFLTRSRSSLSRLRKLSRFSLNKSRQELTHNSIDDSAKSQQSLEETALVLAFPYPPTSPFEEPRPRTSAHITPVDDSSSVFYDSDPFRKVESPTEYGFPGHRIPESGRAAPGSAAPSSLQVAPSPASTSSPAISPRAAKLSRKSLRRLKTFTRTTFRTSHRKPAPQVERLPDKFPPPQLNHSSANSTSIADSQQADSKFLPELSFDQVDFSSLFQEPCPSRFSVILANNHDRATVFYHPPEPNATDCRPRLQLPSYERVDPRDLTASPTESTTTGFSPTGTPLPSHSPSWLSRNVKDFDIAESYSPSPLPICPPSPAPLPILPRFLLPITSSSDDSDSQLCSEHVDTPQTPRSTSSSVTLFTTSRPVSFFGSHASPATNRLSIIHYHRSVTDSRKDIQSFIAYGPLSHTAEKDSDFVADTSESPKACHCSVRFVYSVSDIYQHQPLNFLLLSTDSPSAPQERPLAPLTPFDTDHPLSSLPDRPETSVSPTRQPSTSYQVFVPSQRASQDFGYDRFPVPNYLLAIVKSAFRGSRLVADMPLNVYGKQAETVDYGDEVDYTGYEWFKDPPPRPEPAPPVMDNYVPDRGVIEQNQIFDYALKSAPNVLYGRFKQYGQLGVLAWCSEFSELIDAIKTLGNAGNMFVTTRTQALKTCEEILRLKLKVDMQIIVMYLSSQVARLRRYLDAEGHFDDYPQPSFPLDYRQYTRE
ncbi:hypothetical protein AcW1_000881 [Taiwanofungus camphoratus]|nr:hypothetical protein AcW1_000881 [Antrodia cinnamomea]